MGRTCLAIFLLALSAAVQAKEWLNASVICPVTTHVDVSGHVTSAEPLLNLPDAYKNAIRNEIIRWRFAPPVRDGRRVGVTTWVQVKLNIHELPNNNSTLQIRYAGNGPRLDLATKHPAYPAKLWRARVEARLYVMATVEADGHLDHIILARAYTSRGYPAVAATTGLIDEIAQWKAQPILVDGAPIATRIIIPVWFQLNEIAPPNFQWKPEKMELASDSPDVPGLPTPLPTSMAILDDPLAIQLNVPVKSFGE